jgi:hypothetical protein
MGSPAVVRILAGAAPLLAGTSAVLTAQEPGPDEVKSPGMARRLSILGTSVPLGVAYAIDKIGFGDPEGELAVGGIVLGPVLGYAYAGERGRGMRHAGIRAAVVGGTALTAVVICSGRDCDVLNSPGPELTLAGAVVAAGAVYTILLIVRDINEVGDRVRARNQRLGAVSVQPTCFPESRTAGLLFTWRH